MGLFEKHLRHTYACLPLVLPALKKFSKHSRELTHPRALEAKAYTNVPRRALFS